MTKSDFEIIQSKKSIADFLLSSRHALDVAFQNGETGRRLNTLVTELNDRLVKSLFKKFGEHSPKVALVALGGYGRAEMAPYSDVDMMLLHDEKNGDEIEDLTKTIIYPLWDSGIEVQGVGRTIKDCKKAASEDIRSLTSMMDARFLIGDVDLFDRFYSNILDLFSSRKVRRRYKKLKYAEYKTRLKKYGDSVFVSEPHVKEGEGGLRCYHNVIWFMRLAREIHDVGDVYNYGLLDRAAANELRDAVDFIWRVRHGLHLVSRRKHDRLDYDHQEKLAGIMGLVAEDSQSNVENFMRRFYKSASFLHQISDMIVRASMDHGLIKSIHNRIVSKKLCEYIYRIGDEIHISKRADMTRNPVVAIKAWSYAHKLKIPMDAKSSEAVRAACLKWEASAVCSDDKIFKLFIEIIKDSSNLHKILMEMHETGALRKLMPEFEHLYHRVQYDAYHIYTIDIHTLFLIREFSNLASGLYEKEFPHYSDAFKKVVRTDILNMAGLLHDIGKGMGGNERHDESGARIARKVAARFGFNEDDQDTIEFLVRSHLILPKIAFCRDISDPTLIENFADSVKTEDNLRLLYLLTFADIRATGVDLWSSWKGELLTNLYGTAANFLSGEGYTLKNVEEVTIRKLSELSKSLDEAEIGAIAAWLRDMPVRYVFNTAAKDIIAHFEAKNLLEVDRFRMLLDTDSEKPYHDMVIITKDMPGLFARLCEVLANNNISILEVELNTDKKGNAIDIFKILNDKGRKIRPDFDWELVRHGLYEALVKSSKVLVKTPFNRDGNQRLSIRRRRLGANTGVQIDNDVSAYYTVVDIQAPDRVGLLYRLSHWFYSNGYDISMARAMTHVGQAMDVFYIRKQDGKKIESKEESQELKKELTKLLNV